MADIELLIKIPEHYYENNIKNDLPIYLTEDNVIKILPKGHGRLIDADVVDDNIYDLTRSMDLNYGQISEVVDNAPTIVEADRSEEKE